MDVPEYGSSSSELKRSCEECSSSKIKCSQDKPVCRRCRKQGIACTYAPPKRTGRPRKIRKDSDHSQPRIIRPLASAIPRSADTVPPSIDGNSPLLVYNIEQEIHCYRLPSLDIESSFGLDVVGHAGGNAGNTEVAHSGMECHFLDHYWSTNAQDLETLWGTPLHQQPYIDGGFASGNYLGDHGVVKENLSAVYNSQGREAESGQVPVYSQGVDFSTW
ncbi:hypothetical protein LLEC1_01329 [Akanthomyces lecanii]|uniref:Zn(2)-C6 fungal-type domain-containing protein n=1 Tax=Cordyceps confragosa TaxID=2714763 RepID=A0A179ICC1_CORDF|nr:hypothetical protein LLEC1_01329 [Akanthomyces lecanii]